MGKITRTFNNINLPPVIKLFVAELNSVN